MIAIPGQSKVDNILRENDYLYGCQGNWRSYWQDVADFCSPRKAWMTSIRYTGQQLQFNFLYSVRAILDAQKMAAGFYSNLTNPASKWFGYTTRDLKKRESKNVKKYFKECEDVVFALKNNSSSWDNTVQEYFHDSGVFGTGNIWSMEDEREDVRYLAAQLESVLIKEDAAGRTLATHLNLKYTAGQCWAMWGEACSKAIKDCIKDDKYEVEFDVVHYVGPRDYRDASKADRFSMPWESYWIEKKSKHILEESGYRDFPASFCAFWKAQSEPYGYGPGMIALAGVKLLNAEKKTVIRAGMKQADPAMMMPHRGFLAPLNLNPTAVNYYDAAKTKPDMLAAIKNEGNIPITVDLMKMEMDDIDQCFFVPLFESLSNITKQMTVPEVQRRIAENLQLLGPVIGRHTRVLSHILKRDFSILARKGKFPPLPKELLGEELDVDYISPLAKAQRASEMSGIAAWMQFVSELASFAPQAVDKIDVDYIIDLSSEINGVDPSAVKDQDEVDKIRQKQAELKMKMMQMEMALKGGQAAKAGAEAGKAHAEGQAVK